MNGEHYRTSKEVSLPLDADDVRELHRLRLHIEQWPQREHLSVDEKHDQQHFLELLDHIMKTLKP